MSFVRRRESISFPKNGLTDSSFKDDCDINVIMSRFTSSGSLPPDVSLKSNPQYADFSTPFDYQRSLDTVIQARNMFDALPSKVRARFSNDPYKLLEFVSDPKNSKELVAMGLATETRSGSSPDSLSGQHDVVRNPAGGEGPKT